MPVLQDSEDWRGVQHRLADLERRLGITDSKVDKLVDRQQLQHEENKKELEDNKRSIERIGKMLVGEKGDNGLVGTVTTLSGQAKLIDAKVGIVASDVLDIKDTFRHLPKTILTILLIFTALIGLLNFFGPSIRKMLGMQAVKQEFRIVREFAPFDSSISPLVAHNLGDTR